MQKTLFLAMESVIGLMKEVELQEKAAEQAKQEAAEGCSEIFKRVDELKQLIQQTKEANDMVDTLLYCTPCDNFASEKLKPFNFFFLM